MSNKSILGKTAVIVIIAVLAAILLILSSGKELDSDDQQVLPVKTTFATQGDLEKLLRISGFIESDTMVTVLPRIGGTLTDLFVEMGDKIEKDQILALIDNEPYKLSYNQAKAAYMAADSTFKRISNLYLTKSVSQQNYDEAKANYDALKSTYELAELNLSYTELKAPVHGVILEKHVSRGSMVAPQVPVVTIGDIDALKVNSGVPEIHYSFFLSNKESMEIKITVPALNNDLFKGSISHIAPFITPQSRNFIVKCLIEDDESLLRLGMFVYLDFILAKKRDIFYLPFQALAGGDSLWYVDDEGKARQKTFIPSFDNEEYFQITSDMSTLQFILEGQNFLKDGQSVRILGDSQ